MYEIALRHRCNASHLWMSLRPMDLILTILPVVTKDLPISPRFTPYDFLSRCKFNNLTSTYGRKNTDPTLVRIELHDFRTSRCAGYLLLDHSGDERYLHRGKQIRGQVTPLPKQLHCNFILSRGTWGGWVVVLRRATDRSLSPRESSK